MSVRLTSEMMIAKQWPEFGHFQYLQPQHLDQIKPKKKKKTNALDTNKTWMTRQHIAARCLTYAKVTKQLTFRKICPTCVVTKALFNTLFNFNTYALPPRENSTKHKERNHEPAKELINQRLCFIRNWNGSEPRLKFSREFVENTMKQRRGRNDQRLTNS